MHRSAPAVRYPVERSLRAFVALLLLWCLAAAMLLWWAAGGAAPRAASLVWVSLAVAIVVGWWQWRGMRPGALRWDGQSWWWQGSAADLRDEVAVSVQVRLDLQQGILLRLTGAADGARWRFLERRVLPARWADLRRALYAPTTGEANPPAIPS